MINVNPSAPASSAATAISEMSVTFGVNFARIGTSTASLTAFTTFLVNSGFCPMDAP